jgi:cob(I)alamin adenosyltransferase
LGRIQESLFNVGTVLADPEGRVARDGFSWNVDEVESWIDGMEAELEPLSTFILPGGCRAAATAHVARAVCRRAERRVTAIREDRAGVPEEVQKLLNRLSDALFVLARYLNAAEGVAETPWQARSDD